MNSEDKNEASDLVYLWPDGLYPRPQSPEQKRDFALLRKFGHPHYSGKPVRVVAAPSRNEPCPCGSGKKFKKCCGKN